MVSTLLITARHRHHDGEVERGPARIAIADGPAVVGVVPAGLRLVRDRHAPMWEASTAHQARPTRPPISPPQHTPSSPGPPQASPTASANRRICSGWPAIPALFSHIGTRSGTDARGAGPGMLQAATISHALYKEGIACASGLCVPAGNNWKVSILVNKQVLKQ